jgi:hypothetical protein
MLLKKSNKSRLLDSVFHLLLCLGIFFALSGAGLTPSRADVCGPLCNPALTCPFGQCVYNDFFCLQQCGQVMRCATFAGRCNSPLFDGSCQYAVCQEDS